MRVSLMNNHLIAQDAIAQCLIRQYRHFERSGHDVRVYVMMEPVGAPADIAARTRVVDATSCHDEHFDGSDLHVFHYPGLYPLLDAMRSLRRETVVFHYHNVTPPDLWGSEEDRDLLRRSQEAVPALAGAAGMCVADSAYSAEQLMTEYGVDPDRVRVVPLAVPLEQFTPGPADPAFLRRHGLEGRRVILFVGRMAGNKRIDLLIEALPLVIRECPDAALLLVGDDRGHASFVENVARFRARAAELGLGDRVVIPGKVDDLVPCFRSASVYASASLHEGFGVPPIEAMACGLPVVASRATAHPWVIGDAGLLAEPGEAADLARKIALVLTNGDVRAKLVARGLARAKRYSADAYDENWGAFARSVVGRRRDH